MTRRAGLRRHRISHQRKTVTVDSAAGGERTETWTHQRWLWGRVEPLSGRDLIEAQQVQPQISHRIEVPAQGIDIIQADRLLVPRARVATTLSSGVDDAVTSLSIASPTGFPPAAPDGVAANVKSYHIRIEDEIMTVTAGHATTTWTVSRGQFGTTPATHSAAEGIMYLSPFQIEFVGDSDHAGNELMIMCKERV